MLAARPLNVGSLDQVAPVGLWLLCRSVYFRVCCTNGISNALVFFLTSDPDLALRRDTSISTATQTRLYCYRIPLSFFSQ